jgi:GTP-binding protein
MDIRRVPGSIETDILSFLTGLEIPSAIVLTKCDKVSGNGRANNLKKISAALELEADSFFFSSAHTGEGKKELRGIISQMAGG